MGNNIPILMIYPCFLKICSNKPWRMAPGAGWWHRRGLFKRLLIMKGKTINRANIASIKQIIHIYINYIVINNIICRLSTNIYIHIFKYPLNQAMTWNCMNTQAKEGEILTRQVTEWRLWGKLVKLLALSCSIISIMVGKFMTFRSLEPSNNINI